MVYTDSDSDGRALWKVSIDGGNPVRLLKSADSPAVSPDGKWIACRYPKGHTDRIAIIPFEGGEPVKLLYCPPEERNAPNRLHWTPDGRAITYVTRKSGVDNIWSQPLNGGSAKQLTNFDNYRIYSYGWSLDGKQLVCARGADIYNIILITDSAVEKGL